MAKTFIPFTGIAVDSKQEKNINLLFAAIAALSGIAAILIFIDNRRHAKVQEEIFDLDREIKQLQLEKLKNGK
jgi:cell division protein FtsL